MLTLRDSLHLVTDARNLDESVFEVFETMLGIRARNLATTGPISLEGSESVTAVVGFGGVLTGACVLRCDATGARHMAAQMTGMEFAAVDETVKDGIGEICNMLAGTWKGKVRDLAANCSLSVPAVITGSDYKLHVQSPQFRISRIYGVDEARFELTIVCDGFK